MIYTAVNRRRVLSLCFLAVAHIATTAGLSSQTPEGRVMGLHGRVEHTVAEREDWTAAEIYQDLFVREQMRTWAASRAAILLIDETQVKLNAGAVFVVHDVLDETILELKQGEGWFRTKNRDSDLTVVTPGGARAKLEGTEINIKVHSGDETVLTVVEGAVRFANDHGAILVEASEEAIARPGSPPTKRKILNPEDAVQWALYYPTGLHWSDLPAEALGGAARRGFQMLRAGDAEGALQAFEPHQASDGWSRLGASIAYLETGNYEAARAALDVSPEIEVVESDAERLADLLERVRPLPFSVQIASYRSATNAARHSELLEQLEHPVFTAPTLVRGEVYYRVFVGLFGSRQQTAQFMGSLVGLGIKDSPRAWDIRSTPLAFSFGTLSERVTAEAELERLRLDGIPAYIVVSRAEDITAYHLYAGAYDKAAAARPLEQRIVASGRRPLLVDRVGGGSR